jgi:hypothetical protein
MSNVAKNIEIINAYREVLKENETEIAIGKSSDGKQTVVHISKGDKFLILNPKGKKVASNYDFNKQIVSYAMNYLKQHIKNN